jgi:hypothetical protein
LGAGLLLALSIAVEDRMVPRRDGETVHALEFAVDELAQ